MRAGRLLNLLLLLQDGERWTAARLADRLHVSERTVLRDIEVLSGSGVPVFATRGPGGGFEVLDTFGRSIRGVPAGLEPQHGRLRRVRVRISPRALQLALVAGKPEGWRPRSSGCPDTARADWIEGSFRFDSDDAALRELTALGPDVEILLPVSLRERMAEVGERVARLHR